MEKNAHYAEALHALQTSIITALHDIAVHNTTTNDWEVKTDHEIGNDADPSIQADAAEDAEERVTTLAELETRYRNVTRALHNIATGTYGTCEICSKPIESARLGANPAARTCRTHMNDESQLPL